MTAFKIMFYTTSGALGLGPVILKMPETIILKTLGRPGPHYFKSFPVLNVGNMQFGVTRTHRNILQMQPD